MMAYKRLLLKWSGEALADNSGSGIDEKALDHAAEQVRRLVDNGHEIGIVNGAGNFWRGRLSEGMDRAEADQIGMLATVMNAIALRDAFTRKGLQVELMTAVPMPTVAEPVDAVKARRFLSEGKVVIFAGGTGNPFFSTDSAAALRAAMIHADVILKATQVDGVYDRDPNLYPDAVRYDTITYDEILEKRLGVIDATAAALCRDFNQVLLVFSNSDPELLIRAARGEKIGTTVVAKR
ncbi:MAG: UMP kinase [Clostridiaceae bacterium]|jgi:uridylate kinase|nr:UMP kinase [Clostridiaceae bacterium]